MLECLAVAIFFEARSEPVGGQFAVAEVVINRVNDTRWPDNICDVVFQPKQFSFTHDGKSDNIDYYARGNPIEQRAAKKAREIAYEVLSSNHVELTSTHYHSIKVSPTWAKHYKLDGRIGNHVFYTAPQGK